MSRWSYAASKALDEFLALSYWKERQQPVIVVRLFNTVGPGRSGGTGWCYQTSCARHWMARPLLFSGPASNLAASAMCAIRLNQF